MARRSMIVFFAVGFGLPWLGWTVLALSDIDRSSAAARALFYTGDFMTVAGFVAAWVAGGRVGIASLARRFVQLRPVAWHMVLFALFLPLLWQVAAGLIWAATHGGLGRVEPAGLLTYFAAPALLALTTGPLGEEAGWRGYLLPRLLVRFPPLPATLLLGVLWSLWHYPLYYSGVFGTAGGAARFTIAVVCFSLLFTVLWGYTRGSVLWAILFHWTINISEPVSQALFPDLELQGAFGDWLPIATLVVTTAAIWVGVGRQRLEREIDATIARLGNEAIAVDRWPRPDRPDA